MKTYLDCYPCFVRQALEAARYAGADEDLQYRIMHQVLDRLRSFELSSTAPEMGYVIQRLVRQETGVNDPYRPAKEASTRQAMALYPQLKNLIGQADDPFDVAVRLSIAGNIIDLGMGSAYDLEETIQRVLAYSLDMAEMAAFRAAVAGADRILYLGDNAGETVFDRLLIETLGKPVTYVVKGGPNLNDATRQDALEAGLGKVAAIINNGTDATGTALKLCSADFRRRFSQAQLIIAKGQANYETLSEAPGPIFFLLQAKCPVIARDLDAPLGSVVLRRSSRFP